MSYLLFSYFFNSITFLFVLSYHIGNILYSPQDLARYLTMAMLWHKTSFLPPLIISTYGHCPYGASENDKMIPFNNIHQNCKILKIRKVFIMAAHILYQIWKFCTNPSCTFPATHHVQNEYLQTSLQPKRTSSWLVHHAPYRSSTTLCIG